MTGDWLCSISIHAPVKGATLFQTVHGFTSLYFNPRTREGCDAPLIQLSPQGIVISIHAPVKGATSLCHLQIHHSKQFQSTHP